MGAVEVGAKAAREARVEGVDATGLAGSAAYLEGPAAATAAARALGSLAAAAVVAALWAAREGARGGAGGE